MAWAAFESRGPDRDGREVTINRASQSRPERAYWMAAEQDTDDAETIYDTTLEWEPGHFQIIFHLPNGLQAYAIDVNGERANEAFIHRRCRGGCPDVEPLGLAACPACHGEGTAAVEQLEPRLAALRSPDARIDRATFAEVFAAARCRLSLDARNTPVGCR